MKTIILTSADLRPGSKRRKIQLVTFSDVGGVKPDYFRADLVVFKHGGMVLVLKDRKQRPNLGKVITEKQFRDMLRDQVKQAARLVASRMDFPTCSVS